MAPKQSASSSLAGKKPSALDVISEDAGKLGHKGAQAVRDRLLALKKQGKDGPWDHYQGLSSGQDKLAFALKLKLDHSAAFCMVEDSTSVSSTNTQSRMHGLMLSCLDCHLFYLHCECDSKVFAVRKRVSLRVRLRYGLRNH